MFSLWEAKDDHTHFFLLAGCIRNWAFNPVTPAELQPHTDSTSVFLTWYACVHACVAHDSCLRVVEIQCLRSEPHTMHVLKLAQRCVCPHNATQSYVVCEFTSSSEKWHMLNIAENDAVLAVNIFISAHASRLYTWDRAIDHSEGERLQTPEEDWSHQVQRPIMSHKDSAEMMRPPSNLMCRSEY